MGYSKSKNAIERVKPILEILLTAESDVEIPSQDPYKLVYYIRDGLAVAESLPSSPYKELRQKWRLRAKRDKVVAEIKGAPIEVGVPLLVRKFTGLSLPEITGVIEVIGALVKHRAPRYEFPNALIAGNGLKNLQNWCDKNEYSITQSEPYLILEKNAETGTNSSEDGGTEH